MLIPSIFDAHIHLRRGAEMRRVIEPSLAGCSRALVMPPNVGARVDMEKNLRAYKLSVRGQLWRAGDVDLLFALELSDRTPQADLSALMDEDVVAVKLYLPRITMDRHLFIQRLEIATRMYGAKICIHGVDEVEPGRTPEHLTFVTDLMRTVPAGSIVLEHVHTIQEVRFVKREGIHATITAHHLVLTRDDCGDDPWLHCHPVPRMERDRQALIDAIGHPSFMFGSDSASHTTARKAKFPPAPGIFTAPYRLRILQEVCPDQARLAWFTSGVANAFYGFTDLVETNGDLPDPIRGIVFGKLLEDLRK